MRFKLYKIAEIIPSLNENDKKTLLSQLLHAGKHCSDAKKNQIETAFNLFNPVATAQLATEYKNLASNLQERMEYSAMVEKDKILTGAIEAAYQNAIAYGPNQVLNMTQPRTGDQVQYEGISYKASTWDVYADGFGVPKKNSPYTMHLPPIASDKLLGPGAYNKNKLFAVIEHDHKPEILDTYAGVMQYVMGSNDQDKLLQGVLIEGGFLRN